MQIRVWGQVLIALVLVLWSGSERAFARSKRLVIWTTPPVKAPIRQLRCDAASRKQRWSSDAPDVANLVAALQRRRREIIRMGASADPTAVSTGPSMLLLGGGGALGPSGFLQQLMRWRPGGWFELVTNVYASMGYAFMGVGLDGLQLSDGQLGALLRAAHRKSIKFFVSNLSRVPPRHPLARYANRDYKGKTRGYVFQADGFRVGVLSVVDGAKSSSTLRFARPADAIRDVSRMLRKKGSDLVIGLVHTKRTQKLEQWMRRLAGEHGNWRLDLLIANTPKNTVFLDRVGGGWTLFRAKPGTRLLEISWTLAGKPLRPVSLGVGPVPLDKKLFKRPLRRLLRQWEGTFCLAKKQGHKPGRARRWKTDAKTPGKIRWVYHALNPLEAGPDVGSDGTIYVGSTARRISAIAPEGRRRWRFSMMDDVPAGLAVSRGQKQLFVTNNDNSLYRISLRGRRLWSFRAQGTISAKPVVAPDGTVYFGAHDGKLYAVDPKGKERWSHQAMDKFQSAAAIAANGTVYALSADGFLHAIRPPGKPKRDKSKRDKSKRDKSKPGKSKSGKSKSGKSKPKVLWSRAFCMPGKGAVSVGPSGVIAVSCSRGRLFKGGMLILVNAKGGRIWDFRTLGGAVSAPATFTKAGELLFGDDKGTLFAVSRKGSMLWRKRLSGAIVSPVTIGPKGHLYVGTSAHALWSFDHKGRKRWRLDLGFWLTKAPVLSVDPKTKRATLYAIAGRNLFAINP